jgi:hypothetical protein
MDTLQVHADDHIEPPCLGNERREDEDETQMTEDIDHSTRSFFKIHWRHQPSNTDKNPTKKDNNTKLRLCNFNISTLTIMIKEEGGEQNHQEECHRQWDENAFLGYWHDFEFKRW